MTFGIIGYGQVAKSLLDLDFIKENILYILIRDESVPTPSNINPRTRINKISEIIKFADINLILVNDNSLSSIVQSLSDLGKELVNYGLPERKDILFLHFSGSSGVDVLTPLAKIGFLVGKTHPFQTFASPKKEAFDSIAWLCQTNNDRHTKDIIKHFINHINGVVFFTKDLPDFDENFYHLSAVFAANYLSTFLQVCKEIAHFAGIPVESFLSPIIRQTVENNFNENASNYPISGPIIRKDTTTIQKHIDALNKLTDDNGEPNFYTDFYKYFGLLTLNYSLKNGKINPENLEILAKVLK